MLIKNAKVFYVAKDYEKPKFKRPPILFTSPMGKDVERVSVQFSERWALIATGCNGNLEETLCFSDKPIDGESIFEISFQLSVPCHFYGSNDKSGWHGVCIRKSAEEGYHFKENYWKKLTMGKMSGHNRFDKSPLIRHQDKLRRKS